MAFPPTTYWKCQDVESSGENTKIRKRLFIDLDRTEDQHTVEKRMKTDNEDSTDEPLLHENIEREMYLSVLEDHDETKVHLRVYGKYNDGSQYPTRKGIALDLEKWKKITELTEEIDHEIKKHDAEMHVSYRKHLGENVYVTLKSEYALVNIRKWWIPPNEKKIVPTRKGVALTFHQWKIVEKLMLKVQEKIGDKLEEVQFCESPNV
jgi:hypothetical protein